MREYLNVKRIVEETYELVKFEIYNGNFSYYDLDYVSAGIDNFEKNLFDKYGMYKEDIINHVLFEIYAQVIQEKLSLEDKKVTIKELVGIYFKEYNADEYSRAIARNNCIKLKAKPFINKYKYLSYRNNYLCNDFDILWKRTTISRDIFIYNHYLTKNMEIQKDECIFEFLTPYYSCLIANYTKKYGVFGILKNYNYDKIDVCKYLQLVNELYEITLKYEKYPSIAFYVLEKEFNVVFLSKLVKFISEIEEDDYLTKDRLIEGCLYTTLNPICNLEDKLINNIYLQVEDAKEDKLIRKYKRYPCGVEIGCIRLSEEFISIILKKSYDDIKIKYGSNIYDIIEKNSVYFKSLYSNLKDDIKIALDYFNAFKESRRQLQKAMKSKSKLYKALQRLSVLKKDFYDIQDWMHDDEKITEKAYIYEDYNGIIDNNAMLKFYKGKIDYKK